MPGNDRDEALNLLKQRIMSRFNMNARNYNAHNDLGVQTMCEGRMQAYELVLFEIEKVREDMNEAQHEREKKAKAAPMPGHQHCPECNQPDPKRIAAPGWTCPQCGYFNDESSGRIGECLACSRSGAV